MTPHRTQGYTLKQGEDHSIDFRGTKMTVKTRQCSETLFCHPCSIAIVGDIHLLTPLIDHRFVQ